MCVYISWAIFVPITILIVYKIYTTSQSIYRAVKYLNAEIEIDGDNFEMLELEKLKPDYRIARGQCVHFTFDAPNLKMGRKTRKYTGNTKSGIKLPFMNLSLQNRQFADVYEYAPWGMVKVTMTNKKIRIIGKDEIPLRREYDIINVEEIFFIEDDKTVHFSTKKNAWPMRISFKTHEEARRFVNAFWTLLTTYTGVKLKPAAKKNKAKKTTEAKKSTTTKKGGGK